MLNRNLLCSLVLILLPTLAVGGAEYRGQVVGISDGDTITVLTETACPPEAPAHCRPKKDRHRVRFAEIDAPESSQPFGKGAKQMLSDAVYKQEVRIVVEDIDRYGREVAQVYKGGLWVNAAMVRSGGAWAYRQYLKSPQMITYESMAKSERRGLWALPAKDKTPPWAWRKEKNSARR